jgi:tRNA 2-thiocytidine biosynthesis protein TtcA
LRRAILYRVANELGATKIALGHHRDDILETFFLNMFFGGKLKSMPPKLRSDDGQHIVIRPLAYVKEEDLIAYAQWREFPIIPCNLCGSQENLKRREIKHLMRDWEKRFPGRVDNIFASLTRVVPSHLMDRELFDFSDLSMVTEGDIAFDVDSPLEQSLNRASATVADRSETITMMNMSHPRLQAEKKSPELSVPNSTGLGSI